MHFGGILYAVKNSSFALISYENKKEGEICREADREFGLNMQKNAEKNYTGLPTAAELRNALAKVSETDAMARIKSFFDADTFVELGAYTKRSFHEMASDEKSEAFAGVICGYGAVCGQLVFAFAQDSARMKGALDATHAQKICFLYDMAMKNGAPVVGIFDCAGADIFEGVAALAGYGKIMSAVSAASGVVPQLAWVSGNCLGSFAAIAAMYDMVVCEKDANLYVNADNLTGAADAQAPLKTCTVQDANAAAAYLRRAIGFLPQNSEEGVTVETCVDDLNRRLGELEADGDIHAILSAVADGADYLELGTANAEELVTVLARIGGVKCGILASNYMENEGKLTAAGARKAARFVALCDAFALPLITLVNSKGFAVCRENENAPFAAELGKLAMAYTQSENAKVTIVLGHAIGGAFTLLGSKSVGADVAYALDGAEIGALNAAAAVAFAKNNEVSSTTSREELEEEWKLKLSSPVAAASTGEIDDIIDMAELRQRICSALMLLAAKGTVSTYRHNVMPL